MSMTKEEQDQKLKDISIPLSKDGRDIIWNLKAEGKMREMLELSGSNLQRMIEGEHRNLANWSGKEETAVEMIIEILIAYATLHGISILDKDEDYFLDIVKFFYRITKVSEEIIDKEET